MKNRNILQYITYLLFIAITFQGCNSAESASETSLSSISGSFITGTLAKGTVLEATVLVYKKDGTLLGESSTIENSAYSIARNGYTGKVKVVSYITKYIDEKTGLEIDVQSLNLNAMTTISNTDTSVNVTAVTQIAAKLLGIDEGVSLSDLSEDEILSTNKQVVLSLTSSDFDPAKESVTILSNGDNNQEDTNAVRYGLALSAISADSNITNANDSVTNTDKINTTIKNIVNLIKTNNMVDLNTTMVNGLTASNTSLTDTNRSIVPLSASTITNLNHTGSLDDITGATASLALPIDEKITATGISGSPYAYIENGLISIDGGTNYSAGSIKLPDGNVTIKLKYTPSDQPGTTTLTKLSIKDKFLDFNVTTADSNKSTIMSYADTDGGNTALVTTDYTSAGIILQEDAGILTELNTFVADLNETDVNTTEKIQNIVDLLVYVAKDGAVDSSDIPDMELYNSLGFTDVNSSAMANDINRVLLSKSLSDIDTKAEIDALIDAYVLSMATITNYIVSNTNDSPSVVDYTNIGVTSVTGVNLPLVNDALVTNNVAEIKNLADSTTFGITSISDVNVSENTPYTSVAPMITGTATGSLTYTLGGTDAGDFTIDASTGVVSMGAQNFESPLDDDNNSAYQASITATDTAGNTATVSWTVYVTNANDAPTGTVTIDGIATLGQTLEVNTSSLVDEDGISGGFTYQWEANGTNISAANDNNLTLATEQFGQIITVIVSYTDGLAKEYNSTSTATAVVTRPSIPDNISITNANLASYIISTRSTSYSSDWNVQGEMNNTDVLTISIPYEFSAGYGDYIEAYTKTITLDSSLSEDNESGVTLTLAYPEQTGIDGNGTFEANLTLNDSAGNGDDKFRLKQFNFDENQTNSTLLASFPYDINSTGGEGNYTITILNAVKDKQFDSEIFGGSLVHQFIYFPVVSPDTGKAWLNNNLGADYANIIGGNFDPTQQATAYNDPLAYGSLFQWGRSADGHEFSNSSTQTTQTDTPENSKFIKDSTNWRFDSNVTLWSSESSPSNPCPDGYRVSSKDELNTEVNGVVTRTGLALNNFLKLSAAGKRYDSGSYSSNNISHWTNTYQSSYVYSMRILMTNNSLTFPLVVTKAEGLSVRCIKD